MFKRNTWKRLFASAAGAGAMLLCAELAMRAFGERVGVRKSEIWVLRSYVQHGSSRFLERPYHGWTFRPGHGAANSEGFLDVEHERSKEPGTLRIACLGGSTTAGNLDDGVEGTYPYQLREAFAERDMRPVEVINFGVPGWTSAESLANYFLNVQDYTPDVVVLHHALNDAFPRLWPDYRTDYAHWAHPWRPRRYGALWKFCTRWSDLFAAYQLLNWEFNLTEHTAVPEREIASLGMELAEDTARAYRRNMATIAEHVASRGGTVLLLTMPWNREIPSRPLLAKRLAAMRQHNQICRELAGERGYLLMDLAETEDEILRDEFVDIIHLSPAGNRRKAELIAAFLASELP